jgi:hypothetical protein
MVYVVAQIMEAEPALDGRIRRASLWSGREALLAEMRVEAESNADFELAHGLEAHAIHQTQFLSPGDQ